MCILQEDKLAVWGAVRDVSLLERESSAREIAEILWSTSLHFPCADYSHPASHKPKLPSDRAPSPSRH